MNRGCTATLALLFSALVGACARPQPPPAPALTTLPAPVPTRVPDRAWQAAQYTRGPDTCGPGYEWVDPIEGKDGVGAPSRCQAVEPGPDYDYEAEYEAERTRDLPSQLAGTKFVQSAKGRPKVVGCADGQRELFANVRRFSRIAGCLGHWDGSKSLRDTPTGNACGDDLGTCDVPADVCADGWHVCGLNMSPLDLSSRVSARACQAAGPGRFNAAMSHSPTDENDPCPRISPRTRLPCVMVGIGAESVCCGDDCEEAVCRDGVWPGETRISRGTSEGCGAASSARNGGVLCCAGPPFEDWP